MNKITANFLFLFINPVSGIDKSDHDKIWPHSRLELVKKVRQDDLEN